MTEINYNNEIYLTFVIQNFDIHHTALTNMIGFKPSEAYMVGDKKPLKDGKEFVIKHNIWQLKSTMPTSSDIKAILTDMLSFLEPHKNQIKELGEKYKTTLSFGIYYDDTTPGILLEKNTIKRVADLNINVDFDMYFVGDKNQQQ